MAAALMAALVLSGCGLSMAEHAAIIVGNVLVGDALNSDQRPSNPAPGE